ncbi:hypothetical protein AVEN_58991-1 [Araneus ventricosus]|uniref:Uncharacterized protein n=1 Tax=Araneus ventricosus TaxID=182803 RepID=A0A4Y2KVI0_ARAVE|nr:hypothetical protein AVEN_58991-1 [Araneus ventricosus]
MSQSLSAAFKIRLDFLLFLLPGGYNFHLLNQDGAWLKNNPQAWEEVFKLKEMKTFIKNLNEMNETPEREVKLTEDFSQSITKNEVQTQNILQSVEESRQKISCCTSKF